MRGNVNPCMSELINQIQFKVYGNDHTYSIASDARQFEVNVMETVLVYNLKESIKVMKNGMELFRKYCLDGITDNVDHLAVVMNNTIGIITAINPHIGYEKATTIAEEAFETGVPVRDICVEKGFLSAEDLDKILDPYGMTEPGISAAELLDKKLIVTK